MNRSKIVTTGADIEVFVAKAKLSTVKVRKSPDDMLQEFAESASPTATEDIIKWVQADKKRGLSATKQKRLKVGPIIPCVGLVQGTKTKPWHPHGWPKGYALQEDNVMLEFNIPVTHTASQLVDVIQTARNLIMIQCDQIEIMPVWDHQEHKFEPIDLTSPQAQQFACDPDLDAYSGGVQRDSPPDFGVYRTAGGHIHLGGDFNCPDFVAVLFLELAIALILGGRFVHQPESQRAKWYGQPGIYRVKPYGIEYRTLSNHWACSPYGLNDLAPTIFNVGEMLCKTSAAQLQQWFRQVDWTVLHEALTTIVVKETPGEVKTNVKGMWSHLRDQAQQLKLPGLHG